MEKTKINWISKAKVESILGIDYGRQNKLIKKMKIKLRKNPNNKAQKALGYSIKDFSKLIDELGYVMIAPMHHDWIYLCEKKKILKGAE